MIYLNFMSSVASEHPFPLGQQTRHWFLPALLAPSLYVVVAMAVHQGTGNEFICSPALFWIAGAIAVGYSAWEVLRESGPLHRRVCLFCALLILVYLQMLLPRLWGWPAAA